MPNNKIDFRYLGGELVFDLLVTMLTTKFPFLALPWVRPFFMFFANRWLQPSLMSLGRVIDFRVVDRETLRALVGHDEIVDRVIEIQDLADKEDLDVFDIEAIEALREEYRKRLRAVISVSQ